MIHKELKIHDKFKIKDELNSIFYKETNKYNGSVNTYKIQDENKEKIFEPCYFVKHHEVIKLDEEKK